MHRRGFLALALGSLAAPLAAEAEQSGKVYRIGYLTYTSPSVLTEAFRDGLRDLGYIEGRNLVFEYRSAEGRAERVTTLAGELVRMNVEIIVAAGSPAIRAARNATGTIPIIILGGGDPVAAGFVSSLARPGGNVTGITNISPELNVKRLGLLKEGLPNLASVAVFWDPATSEAQLKPVETAGRSLRLHVRVLRVRGLEDLQSAFATATREHVGGLLVLSSGVFHGHRDSLADLAQQSRVPAIYEHRDYVDAGGLMSYGPNFPEIWRRGAVYVDKIFKGAKPADLPVEQPTTFELVINLKTAKALGLTIPPSLLLRADQVIQ